MNALTTDSSESLPPEANIIAREVAGAHGQMVRHFREHYGLSPEEARQRAAEKPAPEYDELVKTMPANELSWHDLDRLSELDDALVLQRWDDVKQAAREELATGHRAAMALEAGGSKCWDRARFSALYAELAEEWQPRNGIERQLIATMAQAQTCYFIWLEKLMARATLESLDISKREAEEGRWVAPRVTEAQALDQAAAMMDRFNRIFLRCLRALRDLRRYSQQVIVQNAGQVNIGEKQVNVVGD